MTDAAGGRAVCRRKRGCFGGLLSPIYRKGGVTYEAGGCVICRRIKDCFGSKVASAGGGAVCGVLQDTGAQRMLTYADVCRRGARSA